MASFGGPAHRLLLMVQYLYGALTFAFQIHARCLSLLPVTSEHALLFTGPTPFSSAAIVDIPIQDMFIFYTSLRSTNIVLGYN